MIAKASEFNLVPKPVSYNKPLKIFNGADMCKYAECSNVGFWRSLYDGM